MNRNTDRFRFWHGSSTPFVVAAALALLAACTHGYTGQTSSAGETSDLRISLIENARWSMSAHNMQPWEIVLDESDPLSFSVHLATGRLLPATDPYSRQTVMSVGGFLSLLEDTAAATGYQLDYAMFPDSELSLDDIGYAFDSPVAEVTLRRAPATTVPGYLDAVSSATVKAALAPMAIDPRLEAAFFDLDTFPDVQIRIIEDDPELATLKPILKDAFRLEMTHVPARDESYDLTRRNDRQIRDAPWGLSYRSNYRGGNLGFVQFFETLFPKNREAWGLTGADTFDAEIDRATSFLLIATNGNTRLQQLDAGMLFERVWRIALHEGYAVLPASQALQEYEAMADLYRLVHHSFAESGETIQMIAAIGVPPEGHRSGFRIATEELLRDDR
jgi:hypothetical protein